MLCFRISVHSLIGSMGFGTMTKNCITIMITYYFWRINAIQFVG